MEHRNAATKDPQPRKELEYNPIRTIEPEHAKSSVKGLETRQVRYMFIRITGFDGKRFYGDWRVL